MLTLVICSLLMQNNNIEGQKILSLDTDQRLYSTKAIEGMASLSKDRQTTIWPKAKEATFFKNDKLPSKLLSEATDWLRRIAVREVLPKGLENGWVGIRGQRFPDTLALRFGTSDSKQYQVLEEDHVIRLTVRDENQVLGDNEADNVEAVKQVLKQTFRIPVEQISVAKFHTGTVKAKNGETFFVGSVEIDAAGKSVEWLSWSNRFWFMANESAFTFTFTKSLGDGTVGTNKIGNETNTTGRFGNLPPSSVR